MYSQYDEEKHILEAVGSDIGRFLDIGAWDPKQFSNTRALFERGWSGVIVEPSPVPFLAQLNAYGNEERITLIHAAVGPERCCVKFHCTDDAVSTTDEAMHEKWKNHAKFRGTFYIPQFTLTDLFNQFGGGFSFVNIDTEGTSLAILSELLKTDLFPKCICVEHDGRIVEVNQMAEAKGYRQVHLNGTNAVFAR